MNKSRMLVALVVGLSLSGTGCSDTSAECTVLMDELVQMLRTACPAATPTCKGNPGLDKPVVSYSKTHNDKINELAAAGCSLPNIGQAPVFCNNGQPRCMQQYKCCNNICIPEMNACATADGG